MGPVPKKRRCRGANMLKRESSIVGGEPERGNETVMKRKSGTPSSCSALEQKRPLSLRDHPLLKYVILSNVLDYVQPNVEELKVIRQVCRMWHDTTLAKWRRTAVLKLVYDPPLFSKQSFNELTIGEYLREVQNTKSCYQLTEMPYKRYKFSGMTIDVSVCNQEGNVKQFWEMIRPFTEYVHFEKCTFIDSLRNDEPFIQLFLRQLANIKHLALTDVQDASVKRTPDEVLDDLDDINVHRYDHPNLTTLTIQGELGINIPSVMAVSPNLTSIRLVEGEGHYADGTLLVASIEVVSTRNSGGYKLPNLKHLDLMKWSTILDCRNVSVKIDCLAKANLKLETFMVTLKPQPQTLYNSPELHPNANIEKFLSSHASTLQVLKLFRAPFSGPLHEFLLKTQMSAMRELHLWGSVATNFHILKRTPNLKVLYINLGCFDKREELQTYVAPDGAYANTSYINPICDLAQLACQRCLKTTVIQNLEKLHIDYAFPGESLKLMGGWMPNLKSLHTILTKNTVSVACEQWGELTELVCLFGSKLENSNFLCKAGGKPRPKRSCTITTTNNATIGNLKKLERFQLDSLCGMSKLSDACVITGLLKMPSLTFVQICVGQKMSTKAEELLKQRFGLNCRVIRNYMGGDHSNYECCERVQFNIDCGNDFRRFRNWEVRIEDEWSSDSDE